MRSLGDIRNIDYITIHTSSGVQAIKTAKKLTKAKLLGVTTLTSFDQKKLKEIGHTKNIEQLLYTKLNLLKKLDAMQLYVAVKSRCKLTN